MINMTVREDMIGTAFGLATLFMAIGGVVGPIGLGYMADDLGSYRYPFYVLGGTCLHFALFTVTVSDLDSTYRIRRFWSIAVSSGLRDELG